MLERKAFIPRKLVIIRDDGCPILYRLYGIAYTVPTPHHFVVEGIQSTLSWNEFWWTPRCRKDLCYSRRTFINTIFRRLVIWYNVWIMNKKGEFANISNSNNLISLESSNNVYSTSHFKYFLVKLIWYCYETDLKMFYHQLCNWMRLRDQISNENTKSQGKN